MLCYRRLTAWTANGLRPGGNNGSVQTAFPAQNATADRKIHPVAPICTSQAAVRAIDTPEALVQAGTKAQIRADAFERKGLKWIIAA